MAGRPSNNEKLLKENEELKNRLLEMENMIKSLMTKSTDQPKEELKENIIESFEEEIIPEIPMHKTIKVMSLFHGGLNLKTSNDGSAQVFRFEFVGQVFPILYSDLVKILANQRKFFEQGYCMILDKNVVKAHYLEDFYKKFIDAKVINSILDYDVKKIKEIFANTTKVIQQSIVDIIISKINSNDYVDKNKVFAISEVYETDFFELANKMK
jgi:hypothetical protein